MPWRWLMNKEFKLGLFLGAIAAVVICMLFHWWQMTAVELAYQEQINKEKDEAAAMSKALEEQAHAKDVAHQKAINDLTGRYNLLSSELERVRYTNAKLQASRSATASGKCTRAIQKRDDLLLRMAELGLRTSEAADRKQAALKNCVGNYGRLITR